MENLLANTASGHFSSASRVIFDAGKNSLAALGRFDCNSVVQK
jgi:hypothetical protein